MTRQLNEVEQREFVGRAVTDHVYPLSATVPTEIRGIGTLWIDTSPSPPLLKICTALNPLTYVASAGGGSSQGAPADAAYLVLEANARLTAEVLHDANTAGHHAAFVQADHDGLPNPHHSNANDHASTNDPTAGQKAALAGTTGTPGDTNRYVTATDAAQTNARTPSSTLAHAGSHAVAQSDVLTPAAIGAAAASHGTHLDLATNAILLGAAAAAGAAGTTLRSNDTIAAFDATDPSTQAFGDTAVVGTVAFATRRDHKHAMPADPVTAHVTAGDPHTGYRLESADLANADLAQVTAPVLKGRTTAGLGDLEDLTPTQATALLDAFTSALKGLVPASGGGTSTFLRADGAFAAPTAAAADLDRPETGALTVATAKYHLTGGRHQCTGAQRITVAGTGRLRILN